MKKIIPILSIVFLILTGCSETEDAVSTKTEKVEIVDEKSTERENEVQKITANTESFHFVADWLSDSEILFVEKEDDIYYLKSFDIYSGEVTIVYEASTIILDVLVHSSKEKILLHTTDSPRTATIKIISLNGFVEHEITVESSELEIEWNELDPSLILLTAFDEDWTYAVYLYDGTSDSFQLLTVEDPFPKWLGKNKMIVKKTSDDGDRLLYYDLLSGEEKDLAFDKVVYSDTYKDALMIVQMDGEEAKYTLVSEDQQLLSSWRIPSLPIESGERLPEIDWLSNERVVISSAHSEFIEGAHTLIEVTEGDAVVLAEKVVDGPVRCSPSGDKCLVGYASEKLFDTVNKKEIDWLIWSE